jgi:hypothetical protein
MEKLKRIYNTQRIFLRCLLVLTSLQLRRTYKIQRMQRIKRLGLKNMKKTKYLKTLKKVKKSETQNKRPTIRQ